MHALYTPAQPTNQPAHTFVYTFIKHPPTNHNSEYFGGLDDAAIKDNFSTVYQLLEEMMDNGYPLTTEPNALKVRGALYIILYYILYMRLYGCMFYVWKKISVGGWVWMVVWMVVW